MTVADQIEEERRQQVRAAHVARLRRLKETAARTHKVDDRLAYVAELLKEEQGEDGGLPDPALI